MALIDDLRPKTLDEVIGQEDAKRVVRTMIEHKKPDHVLFLGPSGTGKTSVALIIARAITRAHDPGPVFAGREWHHFNSAHCGDKRFIENELQKYAQFAGLKIFVFDEAHKITPDSQHLLLSALEKPDQETFYFFCTTEHTKLIYALRTRCTKIATFTWLGPSDRETLIQRGCEKLRLAQPPKGFIKEIQDRDLGNPRAILNALESAASGVPVEVAVDTFMPTPDELKGITR